MNNTPQIGRVWTRDSRHVRVALGDVPEMTTGNGKTFQPDTLVLGWIDGELATCSITGPQLTRNGVTFRNGSKKGCSYMQSTGGLDPETPGWVRTLVKELAPRH